MARINKEVRIYSSELYIVWDKGLKVGMGATNRTALARRTGIRYGKLRYIFHKLKLSFYEDNSYIIMKINTGMIFKGNRERVPTSFKK